MPELVDAEELLGLGRAEGLDAVGIAPAAPFLRARAALVERKAEGLHAGMAFTYKNPERSTEPGRLVAGARSIVVGARRYDAHDPPAPSATPGRVARYARTDHYVPLRAALWAMARTLRARGWKAVVSADDNSLVDREAAHLAGLGWYGKNANLLLPGQGSWFVLGSVVTDAPLRAAAAAPVAEGCGSCRRCLDGCPTGAIVAPGVVDARRCLAWLVQRPGTFPVEFRAALGDRIYGCDDCQEVCPPNRRFADAAHADPLGLARDAAAGAWVDLVELLNATDDELLARHGRWYIADREPRWLRRNALVALGNSGAAGDPGVADALARHLTHVEPMLRAHAVWAAARLGLTELLGLVAGDDDPDVVAELRALSSA